MVPGGPRPGVEVRWNIEGDPIIGYFARILGAPTAPGFPPYPVNRVFALFKDQQKAERWHFKPYEYYGLNQYVILGHDEGFWVAPEEGGELIYQQLVLQGDIEPRYPPRAVFELRWVESD
ncbi:hypothetical protein GYMLUDRAFT_49942 [Collybiopsis luxurians FD-317 M1]|uniref:Uncharacterized protein n=1 Tax=Collybiopsis luxurians FD-317 M1 TaxID=944289 RepID=A0A0D0AQ74_9AGAR|nr:hypothetical protein GYMLUDRAFT_49942 [Collybiopsis luxurians FD-317 M1]